MSEFQPINTDHDAKSWYQVPWVWFLICIPFSAVIFGVVMIVSANYQPDDLVVDDYYKEGMGINLRLQLDERAETLGASVMLKNVTEEGAVFQILQGAPQLDLSVFHVSDRSQDFKVTLVSVGDGLYTATSRDLSAVLRESGIWYLEVRDQDNKWRLRKRINTPLTQLEMVSG